MPTTTKQLVKNEHTDMVGEMLGIDIYNRHERKEAGKQSLLAFCMIYLSHHTSLEPADFHPEMIETLADPNEREILMIGFRGCAKSTYASLALPLWAGLYGHYHFPILINETQTQMEINVASIRKELEDNELLRSDFPFSKDLKYTSDIIEFPTGVMLLGRSRGMKIRGLKWRQYRPDLVIADDVEDLEWVRKKENRDKTERWWNSEVVPGLEETRAKLVFLANLLHNNALGARLKKRGIYKVLEYPLIDPVTGEITWKAKYPDMAAVDRKKASVGSHTAWSREYLLKIISEEDQVVKDTDIHRYPLTMLTDRDERTGQLLYRPRDGATAVDLAIGEKETNDFTAAVGGIKVMLDDRERVLILPNPINRRMDFDTTIKAVGAAHGALPLGSSIIVEDVMFQRAAIQTLRKKNLTVKGIRPVSDKKARLESVAPYIKDGTILFPMTGCEVLIEQLLGFGVEEHDDLVDALVYLIMALIHKRNATAIVGRADAL